MKEGLAAATTMSDVGSSDGITVVLADDNLIVREGVRSMLEREEGIAVLDVAEDRDGLVAVADQHRPQVVVTDIRMPPDFSSEGIEAAKLIRKRHPGTGIVILSQFDDPSYAISLLTEGAAGYAYLLKDRLAEGNQLTDAIRAVATGGSMLDPAIVDALVDPTRGKGLGRADEELLAEIAQGRPIKAIASRRQLPPEAVADEVEQVFLRLAEAASAGQANALSHLRTLHRAIIDREEQGETLSRFLPSGLAERLVAGGRGPGESDELVVTVLMSDIRGYSAIAETSAPTALAAQLNIHRRAMNEVIHSEGGTVMQYVGDAVLAVFGAPEPCDDHADRALRAAVGMIEAQQQIDDEWAAQGHEPFGLGLGLSTGLVAAALLGSDDRLEYTVVGDTVNLAQRLQDMARPAGRVVLSGPTADALTSNDSAMTDLGDISVKGRDHTIRAYALDVALDFQRTGSES